MGSKKAASSTTLLRKVLSVRFLIALAITVVLCHLVDPRPPATLSKRTLRKLLSTHNVRIRDPASVRAARTYWKTYGTAFPDKPSIDDRFGVDFELVRPFKPRVDNEGDRWDTALQTERVVKYAEGLMQSPPPPEAADTGLVTKDGQPIISDALSEVEIAKSIEQEEEHGVLDSMSSSSSKVVAQAMPQEEQVVGDTSSGTAQGDTSSDAAAATTAAAAATTTTATEERSTLEVSQGDTAATTATTTATAVQGLALDGSTHVQLFAPPAGGMSTTPFAAGTTDQTPLVQAAAQDVVVPEGATA